MNPKHAHTHRCVERPDVSYHLSCGAKLVAETTPLVQLTGSPPHQGKLNAFCCTPFVNNSLSLIMFLNFNKNNKLMKYCVVCKPI